MGAPKGNQYALGNNGGRPRKYETPDLLANRIDEYFDYIKGEIKEVKTVVTEFGEMQQNVYEREPEPATITGLTLFLGFSHRAALEAYMHEHAETNKEFFNVIKAAKCRVEHEYEKMLYTKTSTGSIFALKNMGWADRQELDHTTNGKDITPILGMRVIDAQADGDNV